MDTKDSLTEIVAALRAKAKTIADTKAEIYAEEDDSGFLDSEALLDLEEDQNFLGDEAIDIIERIAERDTRLVESIRAFSEKCGEAEYTDTGEAWELLHAICSELAVKS